MIFMGIDIDNKEISILQLSDSFFPTGLYATSSGLEALSQTKKLRSKDIFQFVTMQLQQVMGPSDCTAMGCAYESCKKKDIAKLLRADESLYYMKLIEETRIASTRSGNQLLKCVRTFAKNKKMLKEYQIAVRKGKATGVYAVSFGVVTNSLNIPKKKAGTMLLYGLYHLRAEFFKETDIRLILNWVTIPLLMLPLKELPESTKWKKIMQAKLLT
jgi:urease accessory protein